MEDVKKRADALKDFEELYSFGMQWLDSLEKELRERDKEKARQDEIEKRYDKARDAARNLASVFDEECGNE